MNQNQDRCNTPKCRGEVALYVSIKGLLYPLCFGCWVKKCHSDTLIWQVMNDKIIPERSIENEIKSK